MSGVAPLTISLMDVDLFVFFFQAEDGIRDDLVTGVQTCALPICFERGADYGATSLACALVARRIMESGGGELQGAQIDAIAREMDQASVVLRISQEIGRASCRERV